MKSLLRPFIPLVLLIGVFSPPDFLAAENSPSLEQRVAQLEAAGKPTINSGDNAWMLTSSALVLMMTAPGLILFYGGLVRRKNVLSTMMHSMILMAWMSVLWAVF